MGSEKNEAAGHSNPKSRRELRKVRSIRAKEKELRKGGEGSAEHDKGSQWQARGGKCCVNGVKVRFAESLPNKCDTCPDHQRDQANQWSIREQRQCARIVVFRVDEIPPPFSSQDIAIPCLHRAFNCSRHFRYHFRLQGAAAFLAQASPVGNGVCS